MEVEKMEIVDSTIKQKLEKKKKKQISTDDDKKQDQVRHEKNLMENLKIKNEF